MAVFNKSIEDEIFTLETLTTEQAFFGELETPGNDRAVFVRQPDNGGEATITGLEIGLIKDRLDFLPGPLATLGFSANLTFNSGDFDILDRDGSVLRTVNPEGLSEPITSATLYYEGDRFSARAAWRYASDQTQAPIEGFLGRITAGNVEYNIDIHRVRRRPAQDGELGERARLHHLGDLNFGLVANAVAKLSDQTVDLRVILFALVRRQAQDVAVIKSQLCVTQSHRPPLSGSAA